MWLITQMILVAQNTNNGAPGSLCGPLPEVGGHRPGKPYHAYGFEMGKQLDSVFSGQLSFVFSGLGADKAINDHRRGDQIQLRMVNKRLVEIDSLMPKIECKLPFSDRGYNGILSLTSDFTF